MAEHYKTVEYAMKLPDYGTYGYFDIGLRAVRTLDFAFTTGNFGAICPTPLCSTFDKYKIAHFKGPVAATDVPAHWQKACPRCGADLKLEVYPAHAPKVISVAWAYEYKSQKHLPTALKDGDVQTEITVLGNKYVLVYLPLNPPDHFCCYSLVGGHWFMYDPGANPDRRILKPRNLTADPMDAAFGEGFYVRQDVYESGTKRFADAAQAYLSTFVDQEKRGYKRKA